AQQFPVQFRRLRRWHTDHRVVAIGGDDSRAVTEPANRFATRLYRTDPLPDLVAEHCDPAIGRAEMFQTMHRDRALRHLRLEVLRPALAFLIGAAASCPGSIILRSAHQSGVMTPSVTLT